MQQDGRTSPCFQSVKKAASELADALPRSRDVLTFFRPVFPFSTPRWERSLDGTDGKPLRPVRTPRGGQLPVLPTVSVLVPCYNEEEAIGQCIHECVKVLDGAGYQYEVLVIDDGSTDASFERAKAAAAAYPDRVRIVRHPRNGGKGTAIQTGLRLARHEILVIQDADLEYPPSEIPHLVLPVVQGRYQVIYGSRFLGTTDGMKTSHRFGNWLLTTATNLLYGASFTDVMTGHKVFTRESLLSLSLERNDFAFEVECTSEALLRDLRVAEMPVEYHVRERGEAKIHWTDGFRCLSWLLGRRARHLIQRIRSFLRRADA